MEKVRPVILMICDYYLPGFESGGAMRTLVNMVDRLSDRYEFKIVTRDHDGPLNRDSYTNVRINEWNPIGSSDVYYLSKDNIRIGVLKDLIRQIKPDAVYLNSFFSPLTVFTLLLRRLKTIGPIPIILAPEGELVVGALSIKPVKKQLYIKAAKLLYLFDKLIWKAASEFEQDAIRDIFGKTGTVFIAPNMPPKMELHDLTNAKPQKDPGSVKMIFLSRFMRKKNFKWFLDIIRSARGNIEVDIFGPIEDMLYWEECQAVIKILPENTKIEVKGAVSHEEVATTLARYHFFVLPTLGENFGHIFVEALAAGCPLIISDRSPWRDLESKGIGWDIPLETPEKWQAVIKDCLNMNNNDYLEMSERARYFAAEWLNDPQHEESNRAVLEYALTSF